MKVYKKNPFKGDIMFLKESLTSSKINDFTFPKIEKDKVQYAYNTENGLEPVSSPTFEEKLIWGDKPTIPSAENKFSESDDIDRERTEEDIHKEICSLQNKINISKEILNNITSSDRNHDIIIYLENSAIKRYTSDIKYREEELFELRKSKRLVENEEIIININELADHYALLECKEKNPEFDIEKDSEIYQRSFDKHADIITSFKRNNNG